MRVKNFIVTAFAAAVMAGCGMSEQEQKEAAAQLEKGRGYLQKVDEAFLKASGFQPVSVLNRLEWEADGWGHKHGNAWLESEVQYLMKKIPDNGLTYTMWVDHTLGRVSHSYDLKCVEQAPAPR